jgi:folate-binding protein YgfZ
MLKVTNHSCHPGSVSYSSLTYRSLAAERARLEVNGKDARRFLHGMLSNDIQALKPGQGCAAAMLTVKGKLLADLVVYDCTWNSTCSPTHSVDPHGLLMELRATARGSVQGAIERHLIMDDAAIHDRSQLYGELGVYGTEAASALAKWHGVLAAELDALPAYHFAWRETGELPVLIAKTLELGMPGFHVLASPGKLDALSAQLGAAGGAVLDDTQAEVLRIEAGTPIYGVDIDEDRMPAEAGLDDAVSYTKGCYLGQEVVVRLRDRGHLNRKLCGLRMLDDGAVPAAGTRLRHGERATAGVITSAVASPRCGTIALGYIHRSAWEPGTVLELIGADEQPLDRKAQVVPLPFPPKSL